jgi:hypothetical protein
MVAAAYNLWVSYDFGLTWTTKTTQIGARVPPNQYSNWYELAISANGQYVFTYDTYSSSISSSGVVIMTNLNSVIPGNTVFSGLPTSSVGLTTGYLWVDTAAGNVLKIV